MEISFLMVRRDHVMTSLVLLLLLFLIVSVLALATEIRVSSDLLKCLISAGRDACVGLFQRRQSLLL